MRERSSVAWTPLCCAARVGATHVIKQLLEADADVNGAVEAPTSPQQVQSPVTASSTTTTPSSSASSSPTNGGTENASANNNGNGRRRKNGANADGSGGTEVVTPGMTALMFAARKGYEDAVTILLDAGADAEARDSCGLSALTHALGGHVANDAIIKALMQLVDEETCTEAQEMAAAATATGAAATTAAARGHGARRGRRSKEGTRLNSPREAVDAETK